MNVSYGPQDADRQIVYVKDTGKFYIKIDIGEVSYLMEAPEGLTIYDLIDDPDGELSRLQIDDESNGILAAQAAGLLVQFETEEDFDGAIYEGDLRESIYIDTDITAISKDIIGYVDDDGNFVKGQGMDWIQDFLDKVELTQNDAPWWNDEKYIDAVVASLIENGEQGYNDFITYGITETGQSHSEFLKSLGYDPRTYDAWAEFSQDEDSFNQTKEDYKMRLQADVEAKGGTLSESALDYAANEIAWGRWSLAKGTQQVLKAIDEYSYGDLDAGFAGVIGGEGFAKTNIQEDTVRTLIDEWLPEELKSEYEAKIGEYAGKIRNNPSFKASLIEQMKQERFELYPQYDKNLRWGTITKGKIGKASNIWGIDAANISATDPTIQKILTDNNPETEGEILRTAGIERNYAGTMSDYNRSLTNAFGSGIVRIKDN